MILAEAKQPPSKQYQLGQLINVIRQAAIYVKRNFLFL